ncbi:glycosyltransferase family 2 protein [Deinococcus soli (ex Cha et al. 2016)]|uniref:Glycosyltransferase involved in cell wall biosynthesis n=2 Tax=Deinococcus soli (ex Cha et al. 2016) TaxID=1309411 RepID=A0AAE4BMN0_9DEIO|nr:glycosyltransferase family 2 protein [Deinococcus soli (ex Cha et al. 2016)]MDR6218314.1 glycosyltransferase involved in cell wall biosynthesis [Deinococcus soli (ex Cha et al. 2016)]MDR6329054.1 glycosyltransferase involved in cell wall biosynthesis [Deinococcus soli (ex Cha et al. 2016)]MDR6751327.1 glycosyltransferase involved in cell wall biosynthesis [Deinococcus soli (ex Cha et al. 2016)]
MTQLSVIIIAQNHERTLPAVIRAAQALNPREVLVVDDGSRDHTVHSALDEQVSVISHVSRFGLGQAVMTALKHTRGEIVTLLGGADAALTPDHLRALTAPISSGRADAVTGRPSGRPGARGLPCAFTRRSVHYLACAGQDAVVDLMLTRAWADNGARVQRVDLTGLPAAQSCMGLHWHAQRLKQAAWMHFLPHPARN